jgi:hypothetical protein
VSDLVPHLSDLAAKINAEHQRALSAARTALEHARRAGELLTEAKAQCQHGQWLPWLKANVSFSERTAQNYMRVATRWEELQANPQATADLTIEEGLKLLAAPKQAAETIPADEAFERARRASDECLVEMRRILADPNATISDILAVRDGAERLEIEWKAFEVRNGNLFRMAFRRMSNAELRQLPRETWREWERVARAYE